MNQTYSTRINTALVTHVLLADGWHKVGRILPDVAESSLSFTLSHFLFDDEDNGMSKPVDGFYFLDDKTGLEVHGPLVSILSVKVKGLYGAPLSRAERLWRQFRQSFKRLTAQPASG